jgi:long-chain fatty acid transport protein
MKTETSAKLMGVTVRCVLLTGCLLLGRPDSARALGLRIPNQDAEAIARGNAFAATADNPSAIYYNPAGITQLEGLNAQFGVHAISINSYFESPTGVKNHTKFAVQPVPEFYVTKSLTNYPITLGLGMFAPYGLGDQWDEDAQFRNSGIEGKLTYLTVNPVVAWRINDQLSVAAGPTLNYAQVLLRQGVALPNDEFKFRGDGVGYGFTAGVRWQICDEWSFGAKYHSPTKLNFEGNASTRGLGAGNNEASVEIPFAQFAAGGISYRPTTNWNFEFDVDWTDWHSLGTVEFQNTPLGNVPLTFNWKSTYMFEVGATRYLEDGYFVSAGYFFSPNSTSSQFFTPVIPDTDLHVGSVGFGHKGDRWSWTIAAQVITGPDRVINNNINPQVDGSYHWMNASLDFSIRRHF